MFVDQTDSEETHEPGRMPLNAGDTGYGNAPGPGLSHTLGAFGESTPLLIPESEQELVQQWKPLNREELEETAGGPGWRKLRCYMLLMFWLVWMVILATAIGLIVISPRPVAIPLRWWQKSLYLQLQPDVMEKHSNGSHGDSSALSEQLPYLKYLGVGTLILGGWFDGAPPINLTATGEGSMTLAQIQHLLSESNKLGLKVVLDFCEPNVAGDSKGTANISATFHRTLRFWLEQGVAGFSICDTDPAYSETTLLKLRSIFNEFGSQEDERILMVKQTRDVLVPLNNITLVDVVMRSILPSSHHLLSSKEVAAAIETHLRTRGEDIWPSWTVGGQETGDLKKLLMVLMMTLPGSPAVQYDEDVAQTQYTSPAVISSHGETNASDTRGDKEKKRRSAVALFTSLSHSRAREEALQFGSMTFLPFNSSSNATQASPSSPPLLAFLRSWGCVHFLVLLNIGSEDHALDPAWAPSLPETGVYVASTGMDRLGSMNLDGLVLRPHEAIVIKLFEAGSYS